MIFLRRVAHNWRVHGLPRCTGYRESALCVRLLWPWFRIGGDGEHAMCWDCTETYLALTWDDAAAGLTSTRWEQRNPQTFSTTQTFVTTKGPTYGWPWYSTNALANASFACTCHPYERYSMRGKRS